MEYRNPKELKPHPTSVALYGDNHIGDLVDSIRELGIQVPLTITNDNVIISGHRRWRSAIVLQLNQVPIEVKTFSDKLAEDKAILHCNKQREKTFSQKMNEASLVKQIRAEEALRRKRHELVPNSAQGKTNDIVGKEVDIGGRDTFSKAEQIWTKAQEGNQQAVELVNSLDTGAKTINRAFRELEAVNKREVFVSSRQNIPEGIFDVFYGDPPWQYEFGEVSREVENQYPTMTTTELRDLHIQLEDHIAGVAVLFLWATAPKLLEALDIMKSWGFSYRTHAIWDKDKIGMGYWFRGQHELLLLGVKGNYPPPTTEARFSSVIRQARTKHSSKPECVYEMIESICPGSKYLELFARIEAEDRRANWEYWGNEIG